MKQNYSARGENSKYELVSFSYAGITRIRFEEYNLSRRIGTSNGRTNLWLSVDSNKGSKELRIFAMSFLIELSMEVFVCKGYSGQIYRVNVNEHLPVNDVIPVIAASLGFYTSNEERVGMYNLTRDWEYLPQDSLLSRGTNSGDLIILADGGGCHKHE